MWRAKFSELNGKEKSSTQVFTCFRLVKHIEAKLGQVHSCVWLCSQELLWSTLVSFIFYSPFNRNLYGVDSNGLVQRAINASNVYENIAGYIEEADKAALLALNTTNRVTDVSNFHNISFYFTMLQGLQAPKSKDKTNLA